MTMRLILNKLDDCAREKSHSFSWWRCAVVGVFCAVQYEKLSADGL
jgi:hypothetical protein